MKKISLITPTFNSEKYLEETIKTVVNQNYDNLEYIIVDGGSTDETINIIKKYEKYIDKFISEKDDGVYFALKKGFELATGEIYGWINSDDILLSGALFGVNKAFTEIEECKWITGIPSNINSEGILTISNLSNFSKHYNKQYFLNSSLFTLQQESTFFSSELYHRVNGLSTEYRLAGDYELWNKFFQFSKPICINSYIGAFRTRDGQLSQDKETYKKEMIEIRKEYNNNKNRLNYILARNCDIFMQILPKYLYKKINSKKIYCLNKNSNSFIVKSIC